jgi:Fic family protein
MARDITGRVGEYIATTTMGETVRAYVPRPLPPEPPLDLPRLLGPIERANQALGRLDGMTSILPSANLFVFMYVRKEALLSSQIEGTQSSLSDLLLFEAEEMPFVPLDDVQEVSNYVAGGHRAAPAIAHRCQPPMLWSFCQLNMARNRAMNRR